jgi:hypothetical protein
MVTGQPASKTIAAASGSMTMLNSATALQLHAASHQHDLLHPRDDAGIESRGDGDVGEPSGRHEGDLAWLRRHDGVDDELRGGSRVERDRRFGEHRSVEPRFAVDLACRLDLAHERPGRSRGERHSGDSGDAGDRKRVAGDLLQSLVADDGGHAHQLDVGIAPGEQHRHRVVVAGVAVEDDLRRHGHHPSARYTYERYLHL